jgi:hypothetical protein
MACSLCRRRIKYEYVALVEWKQHVEKTKYSEINLSHKFPADCFGVEAGPAQCRAGS